MVWDIVAAEFTESPLELPVECHLDDSLPGLLYRHQQVSPHSPGKRVPGIGSINLISENLPSDMSDTTDSDVDKHGGKGEAVVCSSQHEGRKIIRSVFPVHIDQLFTLLFTSSKFFLDFHTIRRTSDMNLSPWQQSPDSGLKQRVVTLTMPLSQSVGPKSTHVCETQTMLPCSKPGQLYAIDSDSVNSGIPYADSFYVTTHYCITRTGDNECCLAVYCQIKYKKNVWGIVKIVKFKNVGLFVSILLGLFVSILLGLFVSILLILIVSILLVLFISILLMLTVSILLVLFVSILLTLFVSILLTLFVSILLGLFVSILLALLLGFIEKNTWSGLEDFHTSLTKALQVECDNGTGLGVKKKVRRRRRGLAGITPAEAARPIIGLVEGDGRTLSEMLSWGVMAILVFLVCLNVLLYYKLWVLEEWTQNSSHSFTVMDLQVLRFSGTFLDRDGATGSKVHSLTVMELQGSKVHSLTMMELQVLRTPPKSQDEWLRLLQQQETLHNVEMQKWQKVLQAAVQLLRQTEESLSELQVSIHPLVSKKVLSVLKDTFAEEAAAAAIKVELSAEDVVMTETSREEL
uniref:VASt domain-containing protein n=1 Tax=Timema tahoe TaxID=61484 RepID=A0A7R9FN16_9NEOP|nr:unnamed protein product [Timema tahoe]